MKDPIKGLIPGLPDLELLYVPRFLGPEESRQLFDLLRAETPWTQEFLTMYEKEIPVPRLLAWYGDPRYIEGYGRIALQAHPWTKALLALKQKVELECSQVFNSVLLSLYRDGRDSVSWHRDYSWLRGKRPVVASVSLGATRRFLLKHRWRRDLPPQSLELENGSLLALLGATQEHWLHQVPKTTRPIGERISLTFRNLVDPAERG